MRVRLPVLSTKLDYAKTVSRRALTLGFILLTLSMAFCVPAVTTVSQSRYYSIAFVTIVSPGEKVRDKELIDCINPGSLQLASSDLATAHPEEPPATFEWNVLNENTVRFVTTVGGLPTLAINYYSKDTRLINEIVKYVAIEACRSAQSRFKAPLSFYRNFEEVAREKKESGFSIAAITLCSFSVLCFLTSFVIRKTKLRFFIADRIRC